MSPKQADKLVKSGKPTTVHSGPFTETFTRVFVKRDRYLIYSSDGGVFERGDLEIVPQVK